MFGSNRRGNESDQEYNRRMNELDKIWNEAIETAAKAAEKYESYGAAYEIRTLKK